jgi:hypothetical protein
MNYCYGRRPSTNGAKFEAGIRFRSISFRRRKHGRRIVGQNEARMGQNMAATPWAGICQKRGKTWTACKGIAKHLDNLCPVGGDLWTK